LSDKVKDVHTADILLCDTTQGTVLSVHVHITGGGVFAET